MPSRPASPCPHPGCPNLVAGGGRCPAHKRQPRADGRKPFVGAVRTEERAGINLYGSARWQKARATHLHHYPQCVQCDGVATTVDHEPPHDGTPATFWRTETWQSMCAACHNSKSGRQAAHMPPRMQQQQQQQQQDGHATRFAIGVTVICGPPGAGKTSYVADRRRWGDLVIDLDALYQALSGLPIYEKPNVLLSFVWEARDALIDRLSHPSNVRHAWIIMGGALAGDRQRFANRGAHVVVLATDASECIRRIANDPRRKDKWQAWESLVCDWWARYEPESNPAVAIGRGAAQGAAR